MLFKKMDLLGVKPEFYILGKTTFKTIIGSIFTIILVILACLSSVAFGIDLFQRKVPTSVLSTEYVDIPIIKAKDLFFAISILFAGGADVKEIDRKLTLDLLFADSDGRRENITYYTRIPLVKCSSTDKYKKAEASKYLVGVESGYHCIPDDFDRDLYGKFGDSLFTLYMLDIG
jgi:hypothetical protein